MVPYYLYIYEGLALVLIIIIFYKFKNKKMFLEKFGFVLKDITYYYGHKVISKENSFDNY
jgi:hypothetical protein